MRRVLATVAAIALLLACGQSKESNNSFQGKNGRSAALENGVVNLAPSAPQLTAIDPYASSADPSLKPVRPFWYVASDDGLTILRVDDNAVVSKVLWPATIDVAQPDGSYLNVPAPTAGWEPVGMVVSYPTDEALASNSETPAAYVYVVMAHSGYEWQSSATQPLGRDPNLRDTLVASTDPAKESSMLIQVDVTDPTFLAAPPSFGAAILGHGAGQPAYDPGTGSVYVGNMPSLSLPTTPAVPNDLTSFVSVIAALAPPVVEAGAEAGAPAPPTITILCGPEHSEEGILAGAPSAWPCLAEGAEGPLVWEFQNMPAWLTAHPDKITGVLDGIIYGTPPANNAYTFQVRVTDNGAEPPFTTDWLSVTLNVTQTGVPPEGEAGFEAGIPNAQAIEGTGSCTPAATLSPGSLVPAWIEVVEIPGRMVPNPLVPGGQEQTKGCVVMGTAPISGEYYEFALPNFKFAYPFDREPVIFSGNVAGPYVFDPLPPGVGISGLAWHQIEKLHDPSTEADILNAEFIGVERFTGQLYRVLLPQGSIEVGTVVGPPETSVEPDTVSADGPALLPLLRAFRADIAAQLTGSRTVEFGALVVEADRDIFVTARQILDPIGTDPTVIAIGGGSEIPNGAAIKVTSSSVAVVNLPGVQAYSLGLNSDLSPGIPGQEPGQVDHGALWVTGTNTGNVAVLNTSAGTLSQSQSVGGAASLGGVSVNAATGFAYVAGKSSQTVAIFGTGTPAPRAPVIWGLAAPGAPMEVTFYAGTAGSVTLTATGWPVPTFSKTGALPADLTFVDNGDGTATLAGTPADVATYSLTITATNSAGSNSVAVSVLVDPPPAAPLITSANTATFTVGSAGSFTVTATGGPVPTMSIAEALPAGVTFTDNEDGTATLAGTPSAGTQGNWPLTITATNGTLPDAIQAFTLVVLAQGANTQPAIVTNPVSQAVNAGQTATFTASASGNPTPTVQWQQSTNGGSTWANIGGATSTSYTTPATTAAMNGYQYRAVFTNSAGSATTSAATLTVQTAPTVTTQPANQTVTAPAMATFTAAASGNPTPTVQWQLSTNGGSTWANVSGATSASYTTPATSTSMSGYRYRAVFTNVAGSATTNAAILTVNAGATLPVVTTHPVSQAVTEGQAATFTAAATGNPTPTIQWQQSTNGGGSWANVVGATSTSYTTPAATAAMNGYRYRAAFTNSAGTAYSNAAILTVNGAATQPVVTTHPANQTVTAGQTATFTAAASGSPTPTVQWQESGNAGATWVALPGATSPSYTTPVTTTTMSGRLYRAVFTNSAGSATTNAATLTVNAAATAPTVTTHPANQTVTAGQTATFTAAASGSPTPTVQWQQSTDGGASWTNITGATSTTYSVVTTTAMNGYRFRAVFTNGSGTANSNAATLTVNAPANPPTITTTSLPDGTAGNTYPDQTLTATGGTPPYTWTLASGALPPGLRLSSAGVISGKPNKAGPYTFTVRVTDSASQSATKGFTVTIAPKPPRR